MKCEFCGMVTSTIFVKDLNMNLCKRHQSQYYEMGKLYNRTKFDPNEIVLKSEYAEIILYGLGNVEVARSIIELEDVDIVSKYKWYMTSQGYCRNAKHKLFLHELIMGEYDSSKYYIDHINRCRLDNRKSNLRIVDGSLNGFNKGMQSNNTSGHVGVSWSKSRNKWESHIKVNQKKKFLGYFNDIKDAIKAREDAEIEYYGELRDSKYDSNTIYKGE